MNMHFTDDTFYTMRKQMLNNIGTSRNKQMMPKLYFGHRQLQHTILSGKMEQMDNNFIFFQRNIDKHVDTIQNINIYRKGIWE